MRPNEFRKFAWKRVSKTDVSNSADYSASKAAQISLHESLRYELDNRYHAPSVRTTLVCPGHILTPLFKSYHTPPGIMKFFAPSIPPVAVVKAIIRALDDQHSVRIFIPFYTHFGLVTGIMPSFVRDFAQWVCVFF